MLKKLFSKIFAFLGIFCLIIKKFSLVLFGCVFISCVSDANTSRYVSYVSAFGPNDNSNNSYYHLSKTKGGNLSKISKYDIRTAQEEVVFALENPNKSITDYYGDDSNLFVVVGWKKKILYHHDNRTGKDHIITEIMGKMYLIRTETGIIVGIAEGDENSEMRYYDLCEDESSFILKETDKPELGNLNNSSSSQRIILKDGRSVVFTKNAGEAKYSYSIDGISGDIDALTSKNALASGIYNHLLVEGDKIVGALQFTEWSYGICPKNQLRPRDLKGSALFEFDINTHESKILYEIKGNKTQIVGYRGGKVYLYRNGKVIRESLNEKKENVIYVVDNKNHQLSFTWVSDTLIIFDEDDHEVVGSCNE